MSPEVDHWERLIQGLRTGDARIAQEFWDQYGSLLLQVAERNLGGKVRRRSVNARRRADVCEH